MSVRKRSKVKVLAGSALAQGQLDRAHDLLSRGDSRHLQKAKEILVSSGQCEALKFLINERKLDVNKYYLLHIALLAGQEDIAKLLIVSGANLNQCWQVHRKEDINIPWQEYEEMRRRAYFDSYEGTHHLPLNLSVNCSVDTMRVLLQSGADVNRQYGQPALHMAVTTGNVEKIRLLIDQRADIEARTHKDDTALTHACDNSSISADCVQVLLDNGADPNRRVGSLFRTSKTAIHIATRSGNREKLQLLLQHGAHLEARTSDGHTALSLACDVSVPADCVRILLENGAFPNVKTSNQQTPLTLAREQDDEEKISLLKQYGASEEERTDQGDTALMSACHRTGDTESVRHLLENNAWPNLKNEKGETALHYAVDAADIQKLQMLVEHNSDVNSMDDNGMTPLMKACNEVSVSIECVRLLLGNRALPNLTSIENKTALHYVACIGDIQKMKLLVQYEAHVDARDFDNKTPLIELCFNGGNVECIMFLLQNKASPNLGDKIGYTALHVAVCSRNTDISLINLLVQYQADVNAKAKCGETPLMLAFTNARTDCVRFLLQKNALPDLKNNIGSTVLHMAAERADRQMMDLLVQYQADVNATTNSGETPLMLACRHGHIDCVLFLLQNKASPNLSNAFGYTALHEAARNENTEMIDLLVQYQADVNATTSSGKTPLMLACRHGHINCVLFLLQNKASPNLSDRFGYTTLHEAACSENTQMIDLLLAQYQADVNTIAKSGETPLMMACKHGQIECAKILLQNNALPNLADNNGSTALHLAAERDDKKLADLLVQYQADVNATSQNGETPLMLACTKGSIKKGFVNFLLEKGALVNLTTKENKTALHYAADKGTMKTIQQLIRHGAHVEANSLFFSAARSKNPKLLEVLKTYRANISAVDSNGQNAIMLAASSRAVSTDTSALQWLIDNGVSVNQQDNNGWTPLMAAVHRRAFKMAKILLEAGADIHAARLEGNTETTVVDDLFGNRFNSDCVEHLIRNGIVNSLPPKYNALLHKMIQIDERNIIVLLLTYGMGPTLCRVPLNPCLNPLEACLSTPISPLTVALRRGNFPVVQYLIGNMVLCPCDLNDRLYHSDLRAKLYQQGRYDIVDTLDEFYAQPKSLFQLSFITVSHIIGGAPGRLDRINTLLLPQLLRDSLLFKTGDMAMDFTSKLPFIFGKRYRGWTITE